MSQLIQGVFQAMRGRRTGAKGTFDILGIDDLVALLVASTKGKYAEAARNGDLFAVCTAAAGQAWLLTNTAAVMLDVSNPTNSNVRLEICKVAIGYVSGTLPAGDALHAKQDAQGNTTPTGGTAITPACTRIGNPAPAIWTAGNGRSLTAAPTLLWPIVSSFVELATTANGLQVAYEDVDGAISVEPGGAYAIAGIAGAGGSSPVVHIGALVRQVPLTGPA